MQKMTTTVADMQSAVARVASESGDADYRFAMWQMALQGAANHPLVGVGIGGIPNSIAKHTTVTHRLYDMSAVTMIHSTYVQVLP